MLRRISTLAFAGLLALAAFSEIKDTRTNPDVYFLEEGEVASSLTLLPPPPTEGSVRFEYDKARYEWGKSLRDTERGQQAFQDARVGGDGVPRAFSEAFGIEITPEDTPEIYRLIVGMREDAGDLATRSAKNSYNRRRPFAYYGEPTCNPEQQEELSTNGSYPSGHTSIGWATALVLAEINPDRIDEILKRGYEMGESRIICGYHWDSDVEAGRTVGAGVVAVLHSDKGFMRQLKKAKKEFSRLKASGKIKGSIINRLP
ncbi:MAG: phosphatase PAP2 family protein [Muribaculaceae bacterium]|nr:phosphatase PAP2 family protein [Muribaculaceae bacterium]